MGRIVRSVIVVAGLAMSAATAFSDTDTPFSSEELEAALRLRLGADHRVEVTSEADTIRITVDGTTRSIVLGEERGVEAARVVALVAAAIALDGAEQRVAAARPRVAPVEAGELDEVAVPRRARPARWSLGATMTPAVGELARNAGGVLVGYDRRVAGVRGFASAGASMTMAELPPPAPAVRTIEFPLRVGAWLGDRVAVGAAALAVPYNTTGGAGDRSVLFGAGVMARARVVIGDGVGVVGYAGLDAMASTVEYRWEETAVLASARLRPWIAIGVTWEGGP